MRSTGAPPHPSGLTLVDVQREAAQAVLPAEVFGYVDAGSWQGTSRAEAEGSWSSLRLRPRALVDVSAVDTSLELLGHRLRGPVLAGPTAFHGLAHEEAELATARAATRCGSLLTLSTRSSALLEDVGHAAAGPWWFQVYATRDPAVHRGLAQRAAAAGATALMLTGDTPVVARKPLLRGTRLAGVDEHLARNALQHLPPGADWREAVEQSPAATTASIAELTELTGLPVLVKGVLRPDDAARCLDAGAAGIVVSNHGGRQLDRAVTTTQALPEVVDAVAGRAPVLVDGGIRDGLDVLTALALGADAVLLGRPVVWALAAGGQRGVEDLLTWLVDDLAHAMTLAGAPDLASVTPDLVAGR
jgi:4-hydroxymandelate oxidase